MASVVKNSRPNSRLHLVVPVFAGAAAWCLRYACEQPDPVALPIAGGVFFGVAACVALGLKAARDCG
jgi:hypothetical protein